MSKEILSLISASEAQFLDYTETENIDCLIEAQQRLSQLNAIHTRNPEGFSKSLLERLSRIRTILKKYIATRQKEIEDELLLEKQRYADAKKKADAYQSLLKHILVLKPDKTLFVANKKISVRTREQYSFTNNTSSYKDTIKTAIKKCNAWDDCVDMSLKKIRLAIENDKERLQPVTEKMTLKTITVFTRLPQRE